MLKRRLCEASFRWELTCEGPLLIADGRYFQKEVMKPYENNPAEKKKRGGWYPNKFFINHENPKEMIKKIRAAGSSPPANQFVFYVPGTSIRGPFRAQAERIIRSLLPEEAPSHLTACDPFEQADKKKSQTLGCSTRLEKPNKAQTKYAAACPACKLFGCAGLASRISFTDADIESGYSSVYRDMIGIDRFTGGVYNPGQGSGGGANMRFHVLENTRFATTITVTNFELWQLGLLAYLFRDFEEKLVPIGFGKTKGFGRVKGEITDITLTYPNKPTRIEHLYSLMANYEERKRYGILSCEAPTFTEFEPEPNGLSLYKSVSVSDHDTFWKTVAPSFNSFIDELNRQAKEESS